MTRIQATRIVEDAPQRDGQRYVMGEAVMDDGTVYPIGYALLDARDDAAQWLERMASAAADAHDRSLAEKEDAGRSNDAVTKLRNAFLTGLSNRTRNDLDLTVEDEARLREWLR